MELVLATHNLHKLRELRAMLRQPQLELLSFRQFPSFAPIEETGATFEENAEAKALHAAKALNMWVLADDSGLVVPALNGAPGVHSRRYAGDDATDADNRKKLIQEMSSFSGLQRAAYFQCTLVLANPQGVQKRVTGYCEGSIVEEERGGHGFGYDPLFRENENSKTFAELPEEIKNRISHRRKALDKILPFLETVLLASAK